MNNNTGHTGNDPGTLTSSSSSITTSNTEHDNPEETNCTSNPISLNQNLNCTPDNLPYMESDFIEPIDEISALYSPEPLPAPIDDTPNNKSLGKVTDTPVPDNQCCITFLNPALKDGANSSSSHNGVKKEEMSTKEHGAGPSKVSGLKKEVTVMSSPSKRPSSRPGRTSSEAKARPKSIHKMTSSLDSSTSSVHFEFTSSGVKVTSSDKESFL